MCKHQRHSIGAAVWILQLQPYCHKKRQGYSIKRLNYLRNSLSPFSANIYFIGRGVVCYLNTSLNFQKALPWAWIPVPEIQSWSHQQLKPGLSKSLCGCDWKGIAFKTFCCNFSSYQMILPPSRKRWSSELQAPWNDCNQSCKGFSPCYSALCLIRLPKARQLQTDSTDLKCHYNRFYQVLSPMHSLLLVLRKEM